MRRLPTLNFVNIRDKTVLLTGAARGIGRVTAGELAKAGANILGVDLHVEDLQTTAEDVRDLGRNFTSFACDLTDDFALQTLVSDIFTKHGGCDILINNAGVLPSGPFLENDFSVWRRTIEVNLLAVMQLTYLVLPHLLKRDAGHIVNISSIAGKFGTEGIVAYGASKHGVVGFSSGLRSELEGTNVNVSWICPSPTRTRMSEGVSQTFWTPVIAPENVARAVRRAIETNAIEVFVPSFARVTTSLIPALAPRLARWILRVSGASRGWTEARKQLPEMEPDSP